MYTCTVVMSMETTIFELNFTRKQYLVWHIIKSCLNLGLLSPATDLRLERVAKIKLPKSEVEIVNLIESFETFIISSFRIIMHA